MKPLHCLESLGSQQQVTERNICSILVQSSQIPTAWKACELAYSNLLSFLHVSKESTVGRGVTIHNASTRQSACSSI
jgi:hypothetical protein